MYLVCMRTDVSYEQRGLGDALTAPCDARTDGA